jgi:GTP-binding protein
VEDALVRAGATPGAAVTIGGVTFDWEPSTPAGKAAVLGGRGSDPRLSASNRVGAAERKSARQARRRPGQAEGRPDEPAEVDGSDGE